MNFESFRKILEREGIVAFTLKDVARVIGKRSIYAKVFLSRLVKTGKILHVERGKYCILGTGELEVASNLIYPAYISFLSALAFHKLTTQIPVTVQVASSRQKKRMRFGNIGIEFIRLKRSAIFGFRRFENVFAAEPEKAILDGLYVPGTLPLAEALYALKQDEIDIGKLQEYAEKFGSSVVKRRLGFLLDNAGKENKINIGKRNRYFPLNPLIKAKGKKNKKWMLIINEVLE